MSGPRNSACTRGAVLSSCGLELDPACVGYPQGGVENFQRDEVPILVVVENYTWLVLVALGDVGICLKNDAERVCLRVIGGFHNSASNTLRHCSSDRR